MRINYNVSAMLTNNALANNDNLLAQSLERLSSGLKVNHGKDNPAGLAMSKRMNAQLEGVGVARDNASNGISVLEIADGALSEVTEMIQRMSELTVKAANDTLTDSDRETIQKEISQLKDEITRISETTEFNGQKLLDGGFELKGYTDRDDIKVNYYSAEVPEGVYKVDNIRVSKNTDGEYTLKNCTLGEGFPEGSKVEVVDDLLKITGPDDFEMSLDLSNMDDTNNDGFSIEATGKGAMRLQVGANEGQIVSINIPKISLKNMSIEKIDVSTKEGAKEAMARMDDALAFVSNVRGRIGAYQNRLESTVSSLDVVNENMTSAYSRIMDVDMAEEMTKYATYQVLTQAGTSMLAQANERPSSVLQLLQ